MTEETQAAEEPGLPEAAGEHPGIGVLIDNLRQDGNWFARKRTLLQTLGILELAIALQEGLHGGLDKLQETPDAADIAAAKAATRGQFINQVPGFLAFLIGKLGEEPITSVEQAAFYLLSADEKHNSAAGDWIDAKPKRVKALQKFIKANRYYRDILDDGLASLPVMPDV